MQGLPAQAIGRGVEGWGLPGEGHDISASGFKINPLFVTSQNSVQQWFSFVVLKQHFTSDFAIFYLTFFQIVWDPYTEILPVAVRRLLIVSCYAFNSFANLCCVWAGSSCENFCSCSSSHFFNLRERSLSFTLNPPLFYCWNGVSHALVHEARSPYVFTSKRWISTAFFFD